MKWSFERPRPTTLAQRAGYASTAAVELGLSTAVFRVLVDGMDDAANAALGAWPLAYYVVDRDGRLLFVGQARGEEAGYDVREVVAFVRRWCREQRGGKHVESARQQR